MKKVLSLVLLILLFALSGCARMTDGWKAKGGIIGSTKSPYIIISQSGGEIMDVYKLSNAIVQSPEGSDGWLFLDQSGNPVYLGGDVKTIRMKDKGDPRWQKYHEYHMEDESLTYRQKYNPLPEPSLQ